MHPQKKRFTYSAQIDWAPTMLTHDKTSCAKGSCRSTFGFGIWKSVRRLTFGCTVQWMISFSSEGLSCFTSEALLHLVVLDDLFLFRGTFLFHIPLGIHPYSHTSFTHNALKHFFPPHARHVRVRATQRCTWFRSHKARLQSRRWRRTRTTKEDTQPPS